MGHLDGLEGVASEIVVIDVGERHAKLSKCFEGKGDGELKQEAGHCVSLNDSCLRLDAHLSSGVFEDGNEVGVSKFKEGEKVWASGEDGIDNELAGHSVESVGEIGLENEEGALRLIGDGEEGTQSMNDSIHRTTLGTSIVVRVKHTAQVGCDGSEGGAAY